MPRLLSIVKQVEVVKVETLEVSMNLLIKKVFQTHHVNNMLLKILTSNIQVIEDVKLLINARIAPGHHVQLDKLAKTNVGPLITPFIMPLIIIPVLVLIK